MIQTTLKIEGMMCSMCEAHINEIIRQNFAVKKVSSSYKKGETIILSDVPLDSHALEKAIEETGYQLVCCQNAPYEQKSIFNLFGRKV